MTQRSQEARKARQLRVRKTLAGTPERPRLNVFRSHKHIYAQVIDDSVGHTLASASTIDVELRGDVSGKSKSDKARLVGKLVAERALDAGIKQVVFDRGGYKYHGRIQSLADEARKTGLEF